MKFQNNTMLNGQHTDPRFHAGVADTKFEHHHHTQMKRNENDVFKTRLMKTEPLDYDPNNSSSKVSDGGGGGQQWSNRQSTLEKMACDSTSESPVSMRRNGNPIFAVPLDPREYRQVNKLSTPDKNISSMLPAEYLKLSRTSSYSDNRPTSTATSLKSGYIDMPGSRNSGSFSRHSARGKKRMLSVSPISSEILDLNEIIRTSPNSLVAFVNNAEFRSGFVISRGSTGRNSSAASQASHGSYGHLSPAPFSQPIASRQRNHFASSSDATSSFQHPHQLLNPQNYSQHIRRSTLAGASFNPPTSVRDVSSSTGDFVAPQSYRRQTQQYQNKQANDENQHPSPPQHLPKTEAREISSSEATPKSVHHHQNDGMAGDSADDEDDVESKQDLRCLWKNCGVVYESQSKLVQHVNSEHIQKNKKDCTCYWEDCNREEKPFKAMYMLVVHVRRHTGEKPHKCHYEACDKAYSRLENLKTHLRSHTGERPYVCEIPGCEKAFSNASDRAKHQNRTHSSVKQYGCKVAGCPKRYTDPSSLRKHMKTVHGALPQNKKMKIDHKTIKQEENHSPLNVKVEDPEDPQSPPKRKLPSEDCSPNKHSPSYYNYPDGGGGGSPSYNPSSSVSGMGYPPHNGYSMAGYPRQQSSGGGHGIVSSTNMDHNIQRNWNRDQGLQQGPPNLGDPLNLMSDMIIGEGGMSGGNLQVQVQMSTRNTPGIYKPIDLSPNDNNRRLSNDSIKGVLPRRESNVSTGSVDSSYLSGTDTYNGSRRDSNHSTISYVSGGRRSATLPSPLPSRNLSPGRINQTVIEGEVLDDYSENTMARAVAAAAVAATQQSAVSPQDPHLRDVTNVDGNNVNMFSRVSSGYGSQQTTYFPAKTPSSRLSPTPPSREIRRASEGTVRRVSDSGFTPSEMAKRSLANRRASDPVKVRHVIDATPRRTSFTNIYSVLPTPVTMQSISDDQLPVSSNMFQQQSPQQQQHMQPQPPQQPSQSQSRFGGGNLMVMPQNLTTFEQQQQQSQQSPLNGSAAVIYAQPDSTNMAVGHNGMGGEDMSMFVDTCMQQQQQINMNDSLQVSPNVMITQQQQQMNNMLSQQLNSNNVMETVHLQQHQGQPDMNVGGAPRLSHMQASPMSNSNYLPNTFAVPSDNMAPHPPSTPRQQQQQHGANNNNNNNNGPPNNYDFTLQWTNNHFGAQEPQQQQQQQAPQQMEPDSTADKDLESLMINGMASLNTVAPQERPKTNMAINRMDSLLTSYNEENKYFEFNAINRYQ